MPKIDLTTQRKTVPLAPSYASGRLNQAAVWASEVARSQGIRGVVVGGYALSCYGLRRLVKDLDFVADGLPSGMDAQELETLGGIRFKTPQGVFVDWFNGRAGLEPLLARVVASGVKGKDGVTIARREFLFALKVVAGRPKDEPDLAYLLPWASEHREQVLSLLTGAEMGHFLDSLDPGSMRKRRTLSVRGIYRSELGDRRGACEDFLEVLTIDYERSTLLRERLRFIQARAACRFELGDRRGAIQDLMLAKAMTGGSAPVGSLFCEAQEVSPCPRPSAST